NQRELVVNHAGNLYRLTGKLRGRKLRFERRLHSRIAQDRWTSRGICRNYFAGLVENHFDCNHALGPHALRSLWINRWRQVDRGAVENSTRHGLENRLRSRTRRWIIDSDNRQRLVRAHGLDLQVNWTRSKLRRRIRC